MKSSALAIATGSISFVLIGLVIALIIGVPRLLLLSRDHAETGGVVLRALPDSHGTVVVRYTVNGTFYERSFGPYPWTRGERVRVIYYPPNPSVAELTEPSRILAEDAPAWIGGSFLLSIFGVAAVLSLRKPPVVAAPTLGLATRVISVAVAASAILTLRPAAPGALTVPFVLGAMLRFLGVFGFLRLAWRRPPAPWAEILTSWRFWLSAMLILGGFLVST